MVANGSARPCPHPHFGLCGLWMIPCSPDRLKPPTEGSIPMTTVGGGSLRSVKSYNQLPISTNQKIVLVRENETFSRVKIVFNKEV